MKLVFLLLLAAVCLAQDQGSVEKAETDYRYNRIEAVYNFTQHKGWNFGEAQFKFSIADKDVVCGGDYFGFHEGNVGMARCGVPKTIKGFRIIPSIIGVFGAHENGPGVGIRWEEERGRFYTQGLIGLYRPIQGKGIGAQYIADPVEVGYKPFNGKARNVQVLYSFEGGRYGLYGSHQDVFHSVGASHPIKKRLELVATVVVGQPILRIGLLFK